MPYNNKSKLVVGTSQDTNAGCLRIIPGLSQVSWDSWDTQTEGLPVRVVPGSSQDRPKYIGTPGILRQRGLPVRVVPGSSQDRPKYIGTPGILRQRGLPVQVVPGSSQDRPKYLGTPGILRQRGYQYGLSRDHPRTVLSILGLPGYSDRGSGCPGIIPGPS